MSTDLIFVGRSLSFSELDLWFGLVNRWRNYAKRRNKKSEPKTFVLTSADAQAHLPPQFTRVSCPSWNKGWEWLGAILNPPIKSPLLGSH